MKRSTFMKFCKHCSRLANSSGQNMLEYLLVFGVILVLIVGALAPRGILTQGINRTLATAFGSVACSQTAGQACGGDACHTPGVINCMGECEGGGEPLPTGTFCGAYGACDQNAACVAESVPADALDEMTICADGDVAGQWVWPDPLVWTPCVDCHRSAAQVCIDPVLGCTAENCDPALQQIQPDNTCGNVDGVWGDWEYGICTGTSPSCQQTNIHHCETPALCGGSGCAGDFLETVSCTGGSCAAATPDCRYQVPAYYVLYRTWSEYWACGPTSCATSEGSEVSYYWNNVLLARQQNDAITSNIEGGGWVYYMGSGSGSCGGGSYGNGGGWSCTFRLSICRVPSEN